MSRPWRTGATVCVFCGANEGRLPAFGSAARDLGRMLAEEGIGIVYGGAAIGLMGALADAALAAGGTVVGVTPSQFPDGDAHRGLTELHVVAGMHERKALMAQLSGAYVVLPGGLGTIDEMFEALTWAQLGFHQKQLVVFDVEGYFSPILGFLQRAHDQGFVHRPAAEVLHVATEVGEVLAIVRDCLGTEEPLLDAPSGPAATNGQTGP